MGCRPDHQVLGQLFELGVKLIEHILLVFNLGNPLVQARCGLLDTLNRFEPAPEIAASLAQLAKEAEKATSGQALVALGQAYLSYGMYDEAIDALKKGIAKGGATDMDEAQISLGIAYLRKGQKDLARQAFKTVKAESKWRDLAEMWEIRTLQA